MWFFCIVAGLLVAASEGKFTFSNCASMSTAISVSGYVLPDTVPNGGRYRLQANLTVEERIDGCTAMASVTNNRADSNGNYQPFTKCYGDFGTCSVPVCQRPGFPTFNPLFYICTGDGASGSTYVAPGHYTIDRYVFFPGLSGAESGLVDGNYHGQTVVRDASGNQLGCWNLGFSLELPN